MDRINVLGGYIGLDGYAYPADNCIKSLPAVCETSKAGLFCDFCHRSIEADIDYVTIRSKSGGIVLVIPGAPEAIMGFEADWLACGECHGLIMASKWSDLLCGALLSEDLPFDFATDTRGLKQYLEFLCGVWGRVFAVDLSSRVAEIFYKFRIGLAPKHARC